MLLIVDAVLAWLVTSKGSLNPEEYIETYQIGCSAELGSDQ
jgi:hypothetical protein